MTDTAAADVPAVIHGRPVRRNGLTMVPNPELRVPLVDLPDATALELQQVAASSFGE